VTETNASYSAQPLANKIAVITGASRGIGRATALRFAEMGATVAINYCAQTERAQETLEMVKAAGSINSIIVKGDVSRADEAQQLIDTVLAQYQRVDILVNNAGVQRAVLVHKMTDADWHDVININLSSVFYTSRAVLPAMLVARSGHIINVTSASGFMAHRGAASYCASKHALTGLTKVLALETADKGILVNAVAPGVTDTDMIGSMTDVQRERLLSGVPLKRMASPREVANLIAWVATEGTYSTGNVFHISGGLVMS
jgi:3-oxoacyl-[acyl-carrier protein] reductase